MIYDLLQNSEMFSSQTLSTLQIILCDDTILGVWRGLPKSGSLHTSLSIAVTIVVKQSISAPLNATKYGWALLVS